MADGVADDAWRTAPIDSGIVHLIRAMNATGWIETIESCEGHPGEKASREYPYVVFHSQHNDNVIRWIDRAQLRRRALPQAMFRDDLILWALYEGMGQWRIQGLYISPDENARIIQALYETII